MQIGGILVEEGKEYCHLCNSDLAENVNKDNQFWFTADCINRHYCSKCAKLGESIMDEFIKKTSRKRACGEYYDAYDLIKLIESLHKDCHGNFKISFDNNFGYDESFVKSPITKDGKPIGVITSVTSEKVEGFIWERYMPIVAELDHNQKPISFEIVY